MNRKLVLRAAGYCTIVVGLYLVYLGTDNNSSTRTFEVRDDVIDVDFEVID